MPCTMRMECLWTTPSGPLLDSTCSTWTLAPCSLRALAWRHRHIHAYACRAPPTAAPLASHKLQPRAFRFPSFRPSRARPPDCTLLRANCALVQHKRPWHMFDPYIRRLRLHATTHASTMLVHPINLPRRANGTTRCRRIHTTWCEGAKASAWRCRADAHQQRKHACAQIHARAPSGLATDR